ncbi:MAG: hypothetical protein QOJ71_2370, partial [Actinomycetota bacterium]|nr:hypothetical protein [Actinomycetota bacterium]
LATDAASTRLDLLAGMLDEHGLEIRARFGLDE